MSNLKFKAYHKKWIRSQGEKNMCAKTVADNSSKILRLNNHQLKPVG